MRRVHQCAGRSAGVELIARAMARDRSERGVDWPVHFSNGSADEMGSSTLLGRRYTRELVLPGG